MKEKQIFIVMVAALFIMAAGIVYCLNYTNKEPEEVILTEETEAIEAEVSTEPEPEDIYVHICGQVKNPGVYQVRETERVADVIKKAGGLKKKAAADAVNQAQHVTDGQQIYIPSREEAVVPDTGAEKSSLVNINTAGLEELMTLPGIGESKAQSIIQYREEKQGFQSIEEMKEIQGIKDGVFRKIQDLITI